MTTLFATIKSTRPALALLGLGLAGLASCQADIAAPPAASPGTLDFTSYVAVGNSLTSGYSDGGLYNEVQAVSYPALLAQQFATTGKGPASFVQPAFSAAKKDGSGYIKLQVVNGALAPVQPSAANQFLGEQVAYTGANPALPTELEAYSGPQPDNLGVPGISILSASAKASLVPQIAGAAKAYGVLNNFYQRLLPAADRGTKDYVTYIGQKTPTFFTNWLGSNDVLTYAAAGGVAVATNPFSGLTDTASFRRGYRDVMTTLTKGGTVKGAVANIPNVTNVPYFNTVTVAAILAAYQKAISPALTAIYITPGTGTVRAATSADLLTLTAQSYLAANPGKGASPANPIPSDYVLDAAEITAVVTRTNQLNVIIANEAARFKVPLVDINTFFTSVANRGLVSNAVSNSATFATGNIFSLDGVHPTPRGYALVANEWIRVINSYYGSTIPSVDPNLYRGVLLP